MPSFNHLFSFNKLTYLISSFFFFVLTIKGGGSRFIINLFLLSTLIYIALNNRKKSPTLNNNKFFNSFSIFVTLALSFLFFFRWKQYLISYLPSYLLYVTAVFFTFVVSILSYYFVSYTFHFVGNAKPLINNSSVVAPTENKKLLLVCILISFFTITICSKCSFLYPINDWVDANCYFTVGKSWFNGLIPYKGIFDHKGPLIYLLHAFAWLISNNTFIGVYLFEIISFSIFLFYSQKIYELFSSQSLIPIFAISFIVVTSKSFVFGDSVEEFALPLLTYCLYLFIKYIQSGLKPSRIECIIFGICAAFIFWTKFNIFAFFIALLIDIIHFSIKNKSGADLLYLTCYVLIGFIVVTLLILLYFYLNGALSDLFEVYFYDNIFVYTNSNNISIFEKLYQGYISFIDYYPICYVFCFIGLLLLNMNKSNCLFYYIFLIMLFTFIFTNISSHYIYYYLVFSVFLSFGFSLFNFNIPIHNKRIYLIIIYIVSILYFNQNKDFIFYPKSKLPQFTFAEIINKDSNATIVNYGALDGGFYLTTSTIPICKYFCTTNMNIPYLIDIANKNIDLCNYTYIITYSDTYTFDNYILISSQTYECYGEPATWYLYKLNS